MCVGSEPCSGIDIEPLFNWLNKNIPQEVLIAFLIIGVIAFIWDERKLKKLTDKTNEDQHDSKRNN